MTRAALVIVLVLVGAAPARADTIVKRVRTSKAEALAHIRTTPTFRGNEDAPASAVSSIRCQGFHKSKAGKAKTWRCVFTYRPTSSATCTGRYRVGMVKLRNARDGSLYTAWRDDKLDTHCP